MLLDLNQIVKNSTKEKYDIVYIDASHKAKDVMVDTVLSWEMLKIGGIMMFDDYEWGFPTERYNKPKTALDGFLAAYESKYEIIQKKYQLHIRKISE